MFYKTPVLDRRKCLFVCLHFLMVNRYERMIWGIPYETCVSMVFYDLMILLLNVVSFITERFRTTNQTSYDNFSYILHVDDLNFQKGLNKI